MSAVVGSRRRAAAHTTPQCLLAAASRAAAASLGHDDGHDGDLAGRIVVDSDCIR